MSPGLGSDRGEGGGFREELSEEATFREFESALKREGLVRPGDAVLLAVSGGADSCALLDLFDRLREPWGLRLGAAHLDHGWRGEEGAADARFVADLCAGRGIPCWSEAVDAQAFSRAEGLSPEEGARVLRYRFLRDVAGREGFAAVALGHHRDDQVESILLHLLRGAGPAGLTGMRPRSGGLFVRPLLGLSRAGLRAYCRARGLAWREDATNADTRRPRNRIRHELLPFLRERFHPEIDRLLLRTARILEAEDAWLDQEARRAFAAVSRPLGTAGAGPVALLPGPFLSLPEALQRRVLRLAASHAGAGTGDFGFEAVERLRLWIATWAGPPGEGLPDAPPPAIDLPGALRARWRDGECHLDRLPRGEAPAAPSASGWSHSLPVPGELLAEEAGIRLEAAWEAASGEAPGAAGCGGPWTLRIPATSLPHPLPPLIVRSWRPGDRIHLRQGGRKKLQDLFVDARVPREERSRQAVVCLGEEPIWVVGLRADGRYPPPREGERSLVLRAFPRCPSRCCR